jgi:hypothetical protein
MQNRKSNNEAIRLETGDSTAPLLRIDTLQMPARAREPEVSAFPLGGFHAASLRLGDPHHGWVQRTALE